MGDPSRLTEFSHHVAEDRLHLAFVAVVSEALHANDEESDVHGAGGNNTPSARSGWGALPFTPGMAVAQVRENDPEVPPSLRTESERWSPI